MQSRTVFTGEVQSVWKNDPQAGKKPTTRVVLKWSEPAGPDSYRDLPLREERVTLVGWDRRAALLAQLKPGDSVVAQGKCQAGRPYFSRTDDRWHSSLECLVDEWELTKPGSPGTACSEKSQPPPPPVELPDDGDDLFAF